MVTKEKSTSKKEASKGRVKVGKLQRNRGPDRDLTGSEQNKSRVVA